LYGINYTQRSVNKRKHHFSIKAPALSSFVSIILPIGVLGIAAIMAFGFNPKNHEDKGQVFVGLLITSIFLHMPNFDRGLPPLYYLTLTDKLMALLYVLLIIGFVEIPVQRLLNESNDYRKCKEINKKFIYYVLPLSLGTTTVILFLIL